MRSRAVKALGMAVEIDSSILGWKTVKDGVQIALQVSQIDTGYCLDDRSKSPYDRTT